jgi:hypothetical protein
MDVSLCENLEIVMGGIVAFFHRGAGIKTAPSSVRLDFLIGLGYIRVMP